MKIKNLVFYTFIEEFDKTINEFREENKGLPDLQIKLNQGMADLIEKFDESIIDFFLSRVTIENYSEYLRKHLANQETISDKNKDSFRYFFGYNETTSAVYDNLRKNILLEKKISQQDKVIITLYGYLIRLMDQVGCMLLNGYPDGALRIWRSFYENSITLLIMLTAENDELPTKFVEYSLRNKLRKINSFQKNYIALKFPALDEAIISEVLKAEENYRTKYGKNFLEKEWGWAQGLQGKEKVTFRDLEDLVLMDRYRPFYIWASTYSHPSFEVVEDFLDKDQNVILDKVTQQNPTLKSLIDPMQLTVAVFQDVNREFIKRYSVDYEYDINISFLLKLTRKLTDTFENND